MKIEKIDRDQPFDAFTKDEVLIKINELIDAINEMSEGCEHECPKCGLKDPIPKECVSCGWVPEDKQEEKSERNLKMFVVTTTADLSAKEIQDYIWMNVNGDFACNVAEMGGADNGCEQTWTGHCPGCCEHCLGDQPHICPSKSPEDKQEDEEVIELQYKDGKGTRFATITRQEARRLGLLD